MTQLADEETRGIWSADSVYYSASDAVSIVLCVAKLGMSGFAGWFYLRNLVQAFYTTTFLQDLNFWINVINSGLLVANVINIVYSLGYYMADIVTLMRFIGNSKAKIVYLTISGMTSSELEKDPVNFINWIYYYTAAPKKIQIVFDAFMTWVLGCLIWTDQLAAYGALFYLG